MSINEAHGGSVLIRDVTLDDIRLIEPTNWQRVALDQWVEKAGTAVASAPAEALREFVRAWSDFCENCNATLPPWAEQMRGLISGLRFCGPDCLFPEDLKAFEQDKADSL